jgi:hypothetical protein
MTYLSQFFIANSGPVKNGDPKLAKTFQTAWGEFGRTGSMPKVWPTGQYVPWPAYPKSGTGVTDPVFNLNTSVSVSNGTLSSASGTS